MNSKSARTSLGLALLGISLFSFSTKAMEEETNNPANAKNFLGRITSTLIDSESDSKELIVKNSYKTLSVAAQPDPGAKETRIMNSSDFNKIFPECDINAIDGHSGKLQMKFGYFWLGWTWTYPYTGSGTLISYDKNTKEFEGITAKHNLFDTSAYLFKTASSVFFNIGEHQGNNIGRVQVTSYIPDTNLDVCLFYGKYIGHKSNKKIVKNRLPINITNNDFIANKNLDFTIIHYPKGTSNQRKNEGKIDRVMGSYGGYETDTLGGSSGAPLFLGSSRELFGVHICGGSPIKEYTIRYSNQFSADTLKVSENNTCVLINKDFIDTLKNENRLNL